MDRNPPSDQISDLTIVLFPVTLPVVHNPTPHGPKILLSTSIFWPVLCRTCSWKLAKKFVLIKNCTFKTSVRISVKFHRYSNHNNQFLGDVRKIKQNLDNYSFNYAPFKSQNDKLKTWIFKFKIRANTLQNAMTSSATSHSSRLHVNTICVILVVNKIKHY